MEFFNLLWNILDIKLMSLYGLHKQPSYHDSLQLYKTEQTFTDTDLGVACTTWVHICLQKQQKVPCRCVKGPVCGISGLYANIDRNGAQLFNYSVFCYLKQSLWLTESAILQRHLPRVAQNGRTKHWLWSGPSSFVSTAILGEVKEAICSHSARYH